MVNPPFKPQLDCRNCYYYERFSLYCQKGYRMRTKKEANTCNDYKGNGSGSGN